MTFRPLLGRPTDPQGASNYDAQVKQSEVTPDQAPKLRQITVRSYAELRQTQGDVAGNQGPRACILAGGTDPLDAGAGFFVWDPTSTSKDDGATVIQVAGQKTGRWRRLSFGGRLLRRSALAVGTSLASAPGCKLAIARMTGGGGGGGGAQPPFSQFSAGAGGQAGRYQEVTTTTIPATWNYVIGAGGAAGAPGAAGGAGGDTTLSDAVGTVIAHGGAGGGGDTSGTPAHVTPGGLVLTAGAFGGPGVAVSASAGYGGGGGSTVFGFGGAPIYTPGTGLNGVGFGAGGGGGCEQAGAGNSGGTGATGFIVLEEFA